MAIRRSNKGSWDHGKSKNASWHERNVRRWRIRDKIAKLARRKNRNPKKRKKS